MKNETVKKQELRVYLGSTLVHCFLMTQKKMRN